MTDEEKQTPQEVVEAALKDRPLADFNLRANEDMKAELDNPDPGVAAIAKDTLAKVAELVAGKK